MENQERNFNILPSGKKIAIHKVANTSLYKVAFTNGGELPEELSGMWTDAYQAQKAITIYIRKKEQEEEAAKAKAEVVEEKPVQEPVVEEAPQPVKKKATRKKASKKKTTQSKEE